MVEMFKDAVRPSPTSTLVDHIFLIKPNEQSHRFFEEEVHLVQSKRFHLRERRCRLDQAVEGRWRLRIVGHRLEVAGCIHLGLGRLDRCCSMAVDQYTELVRGQEVGEMPNR
jgi:hypothetical protein